MSSIAKQGSGKQPAEPVRANESAVPPAPAAGEPRAADARTAAAGTADAHTATAQPREVGGPKGPEPTRYGDWERAGRCVDF